METATPDLALSLLEIVWIDLVLSGDNALVIAMACRALPARQRRWGMSLGAGAAAVLRIVFTLGFLRLLEIPYIQLAGAAALAWIAVRLAAREEPRARGAAPASIWGAVRIIVVADAIMSLDNIVAVAAAARGSWPLIAFGLLLSIPLIMFGASLAAAALARFPVLVWVGVAILGWIAGELAASDPAAQAFLRAHAPAIAAWAPAAGAATALALAWLRARRRLAPGCGARRTQPLSPAGPRRPVGESAPRLCSRRRDC